MLGLIFTPFSWTGWSYEYCGRHNCYCEPFREGYFVRQPYTAASNFGYLLVGALILQEGVQRRKTAPDGRGGIFVFTPTWYGTSLLLAGWFSFFSHASLTRAGEWFDLMGVYLLESTLLVLSLNRLAVRRKWLGGLMVAILAAGGVQMAAAPQWQMGVIGVLLAGIAGAEIVGRVKGAPHGDNRFLLAGTGLYAAGVAVWGLAGRQGGCLGSWFPGHTIWHVLSAAAVGIFFCYFFQRGQR